MMSELSLPKEVLTIVIGASMGTSSIQQMIWAAKANSCDFQTRSFAASKHRALNSSLRCGLVSSGEAYAANALKCQNIL